MGARQIRQPVLVVWGAKDDASALYDDDIPGVWRAWASQVEALSVDSGHHIAEEAPGVLVDALVGFFNAR